MKGLILKVLVPLGVAITAIVALAFMDKSEVISEAGMFWIWPSLFALIFLVGAIIALFSGARLILVPFLVGFVVQGFGMLLLKFGPFESPWSPLWYSLGAIGITVAVILLGWMIATIRARSLERRMAEGMGGEGNQQDLARIRDDMQNALSLLKRAGRGRNAIYELPWFLVMGRPAAGKTVAIKNSGLGLPVRKDWVKGVGGTYTCDWFFTNEMIFLDTPGKWVTEGFEGDGQDSWKQLLKLLQKFRGRRPLDGLVVVVPTDDLLTKDDRSLQEQAANIREVVDLIHSELGFRFPVYMVVSKVDLVEGFVEFFREVPAQRRQEILGWSSDDPNSIDTAKSVHEGFGHVARRLQTYRMEFLAKVPSRKRARKLFFFTEEFKELERPLTVFADAFFQGDRFNDAPVFRGFYFTSGTQGEGSTMSRAMTGLAKTLGVSAAKTDSAEEEPKRSYFLLDLFRELMVRDDGLVSRTAVHWWKQRRNTMFVAFAPAGVALLFLLLSGLSLLLNRSLHNELAEDGPGWVERLREAPAEVSGEAIPGLLAQTELLRDRHRKMTAFSLFRQFGMRRPGALADQTLALYADTLTSAVLAPTFREAQALTADPGTSCIDRIDVLHAVVRLRMGNRAQTHDDLNGLDQVWQIKDKEAESARRRLLLQYRYLKEQDPKRDLLPGFSIRDAARAIEQDCGKQGATSTLEMYARFQESCRGAVSSGEIVECRTQLNKVLDNKQLDYARFLTHFEDLKSDLNELQEYENEAEKGLAILSTIDLAKVETSVCLTRFEEQIMPKVRSYAVRDDLLEQCRTAVGGQSTEIDRYRTRDQVITEQVQGDAGVSADLTTVFSDFSTDCDGKTESFRRLEFPTLNKIVTSHRRVACYGKIEAPRKRVVQSAVRRSAPTPRRSRYTWFETPRSVSGEYKTGSWGDKHGLWAAQLGSTTGGFDDAQRKDLERRIGGEVDAYAGRYRANWFSYLRSLKLKPNSAAVERWLAELGQSTEYAQLLAPVGDALKFGDEIGTPPFDIMADELRPLSNVVTFSESQLPVYIGKLLTISDDLTRCRGEVQVFSAYRDAVVRRDPANPLVEARNWVRQNAGVGLAEGALEKLLLQPLDAAESFIKSDNLLQGTWQQLVQMYDSDLKGLLPFAPSATGNDAASLEAITALLGRKTGVVANVRKAPGGDALSPAAEAWMKGAEVLSRALFSDDSDEPRELKLRVTNQSTEYGPKAFGKTHEVKEIHFYLGPTSGYDWDVEEDIATKVVMVPLLGDDQSDFSNIRGDLAKKKNAFIRVSAREKWKPAKGQTAAEVEGFLAPLQLFLQGLEGGYRQQRDNVDLAYSLVASNKKGKEIGTATMKLQVSADGLAALLDMVQNGIPAPPASYKGN